MNIYRAVTMPLDERLGDLLTECDHYEHISMARLDLFCHVGFVYICCFGAGDTIFRGPLRNSGWPGLASPASFVSGLSEDVDQVMAGAFDCAKARDTKIC